MTATDILQRGRDGRMIAGLLALVSGLFMLSAPARGQEVRLREYALKAALLFNVAKYTDWPAEAFAKPDDPIVVGVLGDDPFGDVLDQMVRGRFVNGRPIVVRRGNGVADMKGAHLVFIAPSEAQAAQECAVLESLRILTVGDTAQTAAFAVINFAVEDDKIVFTVDQERAARIGVQISSKLLHFAKAVRKAEKPTGG